MAEKFIPVWLILKRELRDQLRDWRILLPMLILASAFPLLVKEGAVIAVDFTSKYGGGLIGERLIPFFALVTGFLPVTVSLVISLEAFVGEKERGTIEPLLSTPLKDWQLYVGKLLAGTVVPLTSAYTAIGLYLFLITRAGLKIPDTDILLQTLVLTAAQAVLMVTAAITISTQSTTVRAANLLASFVIIPVAILIQGETVLMFWGNNQVLWLAVFVVAVMAGLLIRLGLSHFQREYLLGREIDVLNLRWMGRTFWNAFYGQRKPFWLWYRDFIWPALKNLSKPLVIVCVMALIGTAISFFWAQVNFPVYLGDLSAERMDEAAAQIRSSLGFEMGKINLSASFIFGRNLRAVFIMMLAGLFSFSVLGMFTFLVNVALIGAALAFFQYLGYSPGLIFAAGLLPHGIFEIPALLLSAATVLHMGAVLVTPNVSKTMGEVMIENLANWSKITFGVIVPLLLVAALIETYVTPILLQTFVAVR